MENKADSYEPINMMENKAESFEPPTLGEDDLLPKVESQADSDEPIMIMENKADSYEPVTLSEEDLLSKCWICGDSFDSGGYLIKTKGIPYWCLKCVKGFDRSHGRQCVRRYTKDIVLKCSTCSDQTTADMESRANLDENCSTCHKPLSIEYIINRVDGTGTEGEYKCQICLESFPTSPALNKHTKTHVLFCVACDQRFAKKTEFTKHMRMHRTKERKAKALKCSVCKRSFPDGKALQSHMEKQHICPMCGKICRRGSERTLHIRRFHTGEKPYLCTRCGKSFCDQTALTRHRKLHSDDRPFACNICGKRFRVKYNLKVHVLMAHNRIKPHQCESCGKCFYYNWQLTNHKTKHTLAIEPQFDCPICYRSFFSKEEKRAHKENFHKSAGVSQVKNNTGGSSQYPKKKFECSVCGKTYTTKAYLNEHMYSHTNDGSGKYKCTVCGKDCVSPINLKQHIKRSHGQKITCPICGKNYAPFSYKRHKLRHTGIKDHACSICGKAFFFKNVLTQHMRTHTGEKPFKCPVCDVAFSDSSSLFKHKKRVHPELSMYREFAEFHGLAASPHAGARQQQQVGVRQNHDPVRQNHDPVRQNHDPVRQNHDALRQHHEALRQHQDVVRQQHISFRQFDGYPIPPYDPAKTVAVYANL